MSDEANLRTMSKVTTETTIVPTERFLAKSAFRVNKFMFVFCHEDDPRLEI